MPLAAAGEAERLAALQELAILDTAPEQIFDDVVALAAAICDVPIAIINFVDADRQWGKALIGLTSSEAPRSASFCARTIEHPDRLMVVEDTVNDPAWASNPQVTGDPGLTFYAGAAITTEEGYALGSVCVADTRGPRRLEADKLEALRILARQTASHLRARRQAIELAQANERLHDLATKDRLTGLANRAFFEDALKLELKRRRNGRAALVFCDMNAFKHVNDQYGHRAGDQLLQLTAQRLSSAARAGDLVARIGGDEFVVLCPSVNHLEELDRIAARLTAAVSEPVEIAGVEITPSMSAGTAIAQRGDTCTSLLARSDEAMYRSKAQYRAVAAGRD